MSNTIKICDIGIIPLEFQYSPLIYDNMIQEVRYYLRQLNNPTVVANGNVGGNHVAVSLYLSGDISCLKLEIYPIWNGYKFHCRKMNEAHYKFGQAIGQNTLQDIQDAIQKGAQIINPIDISPHIIFNMDNFHSSGVKVINIYEMDKLINRCIECGIDMGDQNPRQLCGKTYCYN